MPFVWKVFETFFLYKLIYKCVNQNTIKSVERPIAGIQNNSFEENTMRKFVCVYVRRDTCVKVFKNNKKIEILVGESD